MRTGPWEFHWARRPVINPVMRHFSRALGQYSHFLYTLAGAGDGWGAAGPALGRRQAGGLGGGQEAARRQERCWKAEGEQLRFPVGAMLSPSHTPGRPPAPAAHGCVSPVEQGRLYFTPGTISQGGTGPTTTALRLCTKA